MNEKSSFLTKKSSSSFNSKDMEDKPDGNALHGTIPTNQKNAVRQSQSRSHGLKKLSSEKHIYIDSSKDKPPKSNFSNLKDYINDDEEDLENTLNEITFDDKNDNSQNLSETRHRRQRDFQKYLVNSADMNRCLKQSRSQINSAFSLQERIAKTGIQQRLDRKQNSVSLKDNLMAKPNRSFSLRYDFMRQKAIVPSVTQKHLDKFRKPPFKVVWRPGWGLDK